MTLDFTADSATLLFLSSHMVPEPAPMTEPAWGIRKFVWEVVGEIKIPIPALNMMCLFWASQISNGLDIFPLIQRHLAEHPERKDAIVYGPLGMRMTPREAKKD